MIQPKSESSVHRPPERVRERPAGPVLALRDKSRDALAREATPFLDREFRRLEEFVVPGLRVKDLLTPHFVCERLRW